MLQKKLIQNYKSFLPIIILGIFSFYISFHYGFVGIMPMDNTVLYNGGYKVLNGYTPFTDYWLVTGPLLDYLNAFFFKIFGINWTAYIIHSSFFNLLITLSTYIFLNKIGLEKKLSFFYSILYSILFYSVVGTPFVDHHSTFFLVLIFYLFIWGTYKNNFNLFIIIPTLFCLGFLSKQTPISYGLIIFLPLLILNFILNKKYVKEIIVSLSKGSFIALSLLIIFFLINGIQVNNFFIQYILFASSIGDYRLSNFSPNYFDLIAEFKFIVFFLTLLTIILINLIKKFKNYKKDIFLIINILALSSILIFHQFYTSNQNYIFFLIPFLCAIFHLLQKNFPIRKNFIIIPILICIFAVTKYHLRFNEQRKFNELEKIDLSVAVDAEAISGDLKNLKWITHLYPENPKEEILYIKEILNVLKQEKDKKIIITNYQFIASVLNIHDFSPNQWYHPSVSFPLREHKYFSEYKNFFINKIKKNKIKIIYETSAGKTLNTEFVIDKSCFERKQVGKMLTKLDLKYDCKDFNENN